MGKIQNANKNFNEIIWDRIPKDTFVSLTSLQLGVYDAVSDFNIGIKASVTYEKIDFDPGCYFLRGCMKFHAKCLSFANS